MCVWSHCNEGNSRLGQYSYSIVILRCRFCQFQHEIQLERPANTVSFGFSLAGGIGAAENSAGGQQASAVHRARTVERPSVVRSIIPGSPAFRDARMRCGDLLVAINSVGVESALHVQIVSMLKQAGAHVTLTLVSWPGTVV